MKLSICIPIYNFDINDLVHTLYSQIIKENLNAEIILIDDASHPDFVAVNKGLENIVRQFIFLDNNIGRSRIRNLFLRYSDSDYLLFLDCDGKIINKAFIKTYLEFLDTHTPEVVYGGRKVDESKPESEFGLRWRFAVERENLPVNKRLQSPYLDFQTNNFVVKKSVLKQHPFDETIEQYGYEDLIFASDLQASNIPIDHIDNPIFNNDVETNIIFLDKADQSAKSLAHLIKKEKKTIKSSSIKLAKAYFLLEKTGGIFIFDLIYRFTKPYLQKKLLGGNASLKALDFYKLGQLIGYMKKD